jgi:acyl-CoA thioesterase FadM
MSVSQVKPMLISFFEIRINVHFEFIPQDQIVNQAHYAEILKQLREAVRRKMPKICTNDLIFHHDNALVTRHSTNQFLTQKLIIEMKHPS